MKLLAFACCLAALLPASGAWACRVCRPRVQALIHGPDYSHNLAWLLLPVGLLLGVGLAVYFAADINRYITRSTSAHD